MTEKHQAVITHGPFKGVTISLDQMRVATNEDDAYVFETRVRTPYFLDQFPPDKYSVKPYFQMLDASLPARDRDGNAYVDSKGETLLWPAFVVTVSCETCDGRMVNAGLALGVMTGVNDLTSTVTRARGALYDALGLPTMIDTSSFTKPTPIAQGRKLPESEPKSADADAPTPTAAKGATSTGTQNAGPSKPEPNPMAGVTAVASTARTSKEAASSPSTAQTDSSVSEAAKDEAARKLLRSLNQGLLAQAKQRAKLKSLDLPAFASNEEIMQFLAQTA